MSIADSASDFFVKLGSTVKGVIKLALQSRRSTVEAVAGADERLIVMGNGPSLTYAIENEKDALEQNKLLAVNFAANAEVFYDLKPDFYVMADPVFFTQLSNENVARLWQNFAERIDWDITLFIPTKAKLPVSVRSNVKVQRFNFVGVEGFAWFEQMAYASGRAMPRPRNVLIPSIMVGLQLGFKTIYLAGADHSWSKTLEVAEDNTVVSVQPHFYADNKSEHERVASVYKDIRLHEIMYSFYVAFKSYFKIRRYAESKGAEVFNSTPGSFIDAFERRKLGI